MDIRNVLKVFVPRVGVSNENTRELWIQRALKSIPANHRILDAGAGTQRYRKFCTHLDYVSQDFGEYDGRGNSAGLQKGSFDYGKLDIVSDIAAIPEPGSSFDAVMCIEVLEHLQDPISALKEFSRLLKSGGYLIITAPFCSLTHYAPYHFSTGFNKYWYANHLTQNGFEVTEITPNGNFFEFVAQEIYRIPSVSYRYSKTKPRLWEYFGMFIVQKMLLRFSKRNAGSEELLCFGYNVFARKC
jgi:ubiquinone/menaquinone biosynthesis C-methylase UbiE